MTDLAVVLPSMPAELVASLAIEYRQMESRYIRGDWAPTELNGGRFAEAVLRYLEWKRTGVYTPIGKQINRVKVVNETLQDVSVPDGLRFQVTHGADLLMDFRNKRNVAHLGPVVNVDGMDAHLVIRLASWILAEIVREEGGVNSAEAQSVIDRLSARKLPLVEEVGGDLLVVATDLNAGTRVLVALYREYPKPVSLTILRQAVGYQNITKFRALLNSRAKSGLVHLKKSDVFLTGKGAAWVEENVDLELRV